MTVYARSDVMSVTHPETGETFSRTDPAVFAIDSDPEHEAFLLATFPDLYSRLPAEVPPTSDEIAEMAQHEQEAHAFIHLRARDAAAVLDETRGRSNRTLAERSERPT